MTVCGFIFFSSAIKSSTRNPALIFNRSTLQNAFRNLVGTQRWSFFDFRCSIGNDWENNVRKSENTRKFHARFIESCFFGVNPKNRFSQMWHAKNRILLAPVYRRAQININSFAYSTPPPLPPECPLGNDQRDGTLEK